MVGRHVCAVYWCHTVGIFFIPTFTTSLLPSYDTPSYQKWFAQTLHSFFVRWFDWLRSENLYALDTPFAWPTPNCPMCANLFLLEVRQQTETFRLSLWETKLKRDKETEAQKTGQTDWKWDSDHRKREREWSRVRQTQQERGRWLPCSETDKETTICRNNRQFTLGTQSCTQNKDKATDVQC